MGHIITKDEAIRRIEQIYHARYDPDSDFGLYDQLLACEAFAEADEEYGEGNKNQ